MRLNARRLLLVLLIHSCQTCAGPVIGPQDLPGRYCASWDRNFVVELQSDGKMIQTVRYRNGQTARTTGWWQSQPRAFELEISLDPWRGATTQEKPGAFFTTVSGSRSDIHIVINVDYGQYLTKCP